MKPNFRRSILLATAFALTTAVQMPLTHPTSPTQALTGGGAVTELQITGRAGVPTNATAAVINLTALDSTTAGFVTAYPCGSTRPDASNLNYTPGGTAIANSATVPIGTGGKVCLYTSSATNLIADINGWYPTNSGFTTTTPTRLLDTRTPATTPSAPTPTPTATGQFVETFDGNTGLDRFDKGVHHRDGPASGTVSADHDVNCGSPETQRTVYADKPSTSFYTCRDHLMTAIGDWSGYSVGWFTPKQTFTNASTVSWDVNVTDLGARQWWEVAIVPASFRSGYTDCPQCAIIDWLSPDPSHLPVFPRGSVVVGNGPFGGDIKVSTDGRDHGVSPNSNVCALDAAGCASKATRRPFSITDNRNGTVTIRYAGFATYTVPGSFPAGGFNVVFKDHNYTPDKEGRPVGHTWHWDNIVVK